MQLIIRDMPDDLHRELKIEAAKRSMSLKGLIIQILKDYIMRGYKS